MKKKKVKDENKLDTEAAVAHKKIYQMTQSQIPVRDITNGCVLTKDKRLVKILEVHPVPFNNLKPNAKNLIRANFENFIKAMPDTFQIKSVSFPADLKAQINDLEEASSKETNEDRLKLTNEYYKSLNYAQSQTIERRFFVAFSEDDEKKTKIEDFERSINKLNSIASRAAASLNNCGNGAIPLENADIAKLFYFLLNRNSKVHFDEMYTKIYSEYIKRLGSKNDIYIPPTDYIAPMDYYDDKGKFEMGSMYFTDKKFIKINDRYYTWLYIASDGYPKSISCGWVDNFVSFCEGVDVDIFFKKKDSRKIKEKLRQTIGHVSSDASELQSNVSDSSFNVQAKYQSAEYLLECVQAGQDIYDVSTVLTISGQSIKEVNDICESIIEQSKNLDMKILDLRYQEEIAFQSTLPLNQLSPKIEKKAKRNMPRMVAATMYPFTAFQLIHNNGIYFAYACDNNSPVIPNFWLTSLFINPHIFVCGTSGAGKTSCLELLSDRASIMGIPCFIIAPQKQDDYKRICTHLGGQFISFGEGSPHRINILEIFPTEKATDETNELLYGELGVNRMSLVKQRQGIVTNFIHTHYTEMSRAEMAILGDALTMAYAKYGITEDNESLWADAEKTHYKKMPILSDVLEAVESMNNPDAKNLILELKFFTSGIGSYFNGETNIDIDNKYFVIGLENNSKETKPLSVFLAEDFCQNKIRRDKNKKFFMIDESWDLVQNNITGQKLAEDSKILRGFGASVVCGTQQLSDLLGTEYGPIIIKNSETRIIMKHTSEDVKYLSQYIDLTSDEQKRMQSYDAGVGLLLANQDRVEIKFNPTDYEGLITFNDKDTLARYKQFVINEQQEKERLKRLEELKKISKPLDQLQSTDDTYSFHIEQNKYNELFKKEGQ